MRINIPFEFDTICSAWQAIEMSQCINDRSELNYIFRIQWMIVADIADIYLVDWKEPD